MALHNHAKNNQHLHPVQSSHAPASGCLGPLSTTILRLNFCSRSKRNTGHSVNRIRRVDKTPINMYPACFDQNSDRHQKQPCQQRRLQSLGMSDVSNIVCGRESHDCQMHDMQCHFRIILFLQQIVVSF
jgi:hypothetical protein